VYYHVIVETNDKDKRGHYERCYEVDGTNLDEIKTLIVAPYVNREPIYIDGRHIPFDNIRRLKVKQSEQSARVLRDRAQRMKPANVIAVYTVNMIVNSDTYVADITKEVVGSVGNILRVGPNGVKTDAVPKNSVFIVHGRDDLAKTEVARFVEKLGFEAVILHEQVSSGKTIIEKIEEYTNVGFAIVLYTPCDQGGLAGGSQRKFRARQNVVFEHGFLIGKLKRENVCALVKDDVEIPNDISGVVYISFDNHAAWRLAVAKEMRQAGYAVDMNKVV